jgi:outer membrane protein assembly factor BamD
MRISKLKYRLLLAAFLMPLVVSLFSCASSKKEIPLMSSQDYYGEAENLMARGKYKDAKVMLEEARNRYRTGDLDAKLLIALGDAHYYLEEYEESIEVYREFIRLHPRHPMASEVQYQIGMSCYQMIRPKDRDPEPAAQAVDEFTKVIENYPRSPQARKAGERITTCRNALAEKEIFVARFYMKKKNYRGAINRLETLLVEYEDLGFEEETLYLIGEAYRRMEEDDKAQDYFMLLLERYPASRYNEDVRDYLEERRG